MVLAFVPLPVHFFLSLENSHQLAALTLVLIAGVYLGYAFKDGRSGVIVTELLAALGFTGAAWLGLNGLPVVIIVALVVHGIWDLLHHSLIETEIPRWYIPFCAAVDWVLATCLFAIWTFGF
ncbi:DUF6010 family protein [uncultured Roseobacter sp.]|uniref:DUF6010 family protein n=1 Tax=uncultured Roseobacter sp. TaxID=114847 RepID=UPI00260881AF|nr:DUF6010 family protein [uncultured Roseobacter sp.]